MLLTHLGHSCLLVEAGGARVLLDPGGFSQGFEQLTGLDAIAITHQHPDHMDTERLPMLVEANPGAVLLAEPQAAEELAKVALNPQPLPPGERVELAALRLEGVGGRHALIHDDVPRIGNTGVLLAADGEPTLFHPGDAYEAVPDGVDLLAVPLNAPWAALKETVAFVRAVAPGAAFGIHDGLLSDTGRGLYLRVLGGLVPEGTSMLEIGPDGVEVGPELSSTSGR